MKSKAAIIKKATKGLIIISITLVLISLIVALPKGKGTSYANKYEDLEFVDDNEEIGRKDTYSKYKESFKDANKPQEIINVNLINVEKDQGVEVLDNYKGEKNVIFTEGGSLAQWNVEVKEEGLYQIYMEYYPIESRGTDIERKFYINKELPFVGADRLKFTRLWGDEGEVRQDNQGNDIRPTQVELAQWTGDYFKDDMGYEVEPYMFYFNKGNNAIALQAVNEPMVIKSITLKAVENPISYLEYRQKTPVIEVSSEAANYKQVIQGEESSLRVSPSLYSTYDRSSPATEPYSVSKVRLNMGGGNAWRIPGQWIEWELEVPDDGYYTITIKGRQNYQRGFVSNRNLYIDGKIPFQEVKEIGFKYSNEWESVTLGDEKAESYEFYLPKGRHNLRLEVTLGELGNILVNLEESVYRLNEMYRKILVLTGVTPDRFRDYKIEKVYPEVIDAMALESKRLYEIVDDIVVYTGQKANQAAVIQTLASQLERFVERPDKIPVTLGNFKNNISALGTVILSMSEAPLDIDYITITGTGATPDKFNENFLNKMIHEIRSFIASFFIDYDSIGNVHEKAEAIEVWLLSGRDQSTVLKTMIDDTFTPETDIKVNVKLVEGGTLLNAVIAGKGPDVVLSNGQGEPVNYALRNALEDLTQFKDYKEVLASYYPSAYRPYLFNDGIYAIPETQNYNVMFYRKDILEELELELPQTWDELINMLPTIQQNNMTVAIPSVERKIGNTSNPDLSTLIAMLYQNGGELYAGEGKYTTIDGSSGVAAFEIYTKLFTHYGLPKEYDFPNRFRSGEIPIGIQDFNMYNTLVVFAPEIRGLWDFTMIPGVLQEDGTIDRSAYSSGQCSMMMKQDNEDIKIKSWEFMKWWASADTQVRFGREMESILGASARYATANKEAFQRLAWSSDQMKVLEEQWKWVKGADEVAGGYYTFRHITNAVRKVVNNNEDQRETLLDYARTINEEIEKKRLEFELDTK